MSTTPTPDSPQSQTAKFEQLVRELDRDEDEARFEETVPKISEAPPMPKPKAETAY